MHIKHYLAEFVIVKVGITIAYIQVNTSKKFTQIRQWYSYHKLKIRSELFDVILVLILMRGNTDSHLRNRCTIGRGVSVT